jgi:hypothetical protein
MKSHARVFLIVVAALVMGTLTVAVAPTASAQVAVSGTFPLPHGAISFNVGGPGYYAPAPYPYAYSYPAPAYPVYYTGYYAPYYYPYHRHYYRRYYPAYHGHVSHYHGGYGGYHGH